MSQPPPEGFPPPDDSPDPGAQPGPSDAGQTSPSGSPSTGPQYPAAPTPPGAYPPPPSGPPPGYQGQPAPGQGGYPPPPPGYQQGPPPGYQQGPPPGYQQGPPPGYQQGPPAGSPVQGSYGPPPGYGPPAGPPPGYGPPPGAPAGYGPPQGASGYGPPPGAPGAYGSPQGAYPAPAGGAPKPAFDVSKISIAGWGVLGASLLTLIASFFPFWSVSGVGFLGLAGSATGWASWWWLPMVLAVVVGVLYALQLFGVLTTSQVKPEWLVYGAAASFVLMIFVLINTFLYNGPQGVFEGYPSSPSFGVFLAVVTTAALTYFTALAAQGAGAKLPFKVPGPA